ncbi:MAG: AbrB/MazE/SpoVT family DNA-binding domain-containing protein [Ketobacter sp.]|nr:AbrB/MazE/SpoVT family DNA-binding domain-containing protein [Ketobacter sp.]
MVVVTIRRSGGASVISLPKRALSALGLAVGSRLSVSIRDGGIVLSPQEEALTLESILAGSPKERLLLTEEDREWLGAKPGLPPLS